MALKTCLVGSYPPITDLQTGLLDEEREATEEIIHKGIQRAVEDQIKLEVDILVDGQIRSDIISLYTKQLGGYDPNAIPFRVIGKITRSVTPITVADYMYARDLAGLRPMTAHITGPVTLARASRINSNLSPYRDRNDPRMLMDIAEALCYEAEALVKAGAEVIQIDEPALADGVDLDVAFNAIRLIAEHARIPFPALHICGNVTHILQEVLEKCPVRMVSIEGAFLNHPKLQFIDAGYLSNTGKQIGLGCIQVVDHHVDRQRAVQDFLDAMVLRLGEENIWAAMPNCGLRTMPIDVAREKVNVLVKAAQALNLAGAVLY